MLHFSLVHIVQYGSCRDPCHHITQLAALSRFSSTANTALVNRYVTEGVLGSTYRCKQWRRTRQKSQSFPARIRTHSQPEFWQAGKKSSRTQAIPCLRTPSRRISPIPEVDPLAWIATRGLTPCSRVQQRLRWKASWTVQSYNDSSLTSICRKEVSKTSTPPTSMGNMDTLGSVALGT